MARKVISGYTIRKLKTAVEESRMLGSTKHTERLEKILVEIEKSSLAVLSKKKKKPQVPVESRPQFIGWVRMYRRLAERLNLPPIFGNEFGYWKMWWKTQELFIAAGQPGPWTEGDALESAIRTEIGFSNHVNFRWLCSSKGRVPNIQSMMERDRPASQEPETRTIEQVRREAEESF